MYGKARFTSFEMCERFIRGIHAIGCKAWMKGDGTNTVVYLLTEPMDIPLLLTCPACGVNHNWPTEDELCEDCEEEFFTIRQMADK